MKLRHPHRALRRRIEGKIRAEIAHYPGTSAKFYPYRPELRSYVVPKTERDVGLGLPVPPPDIMIHPGGPENYVNLGRTLVGRMKELLQASGFTLKPGHSILDLGCADAMMLRALEDFAVEGSEVWGVDISGRHIYWCQQNLSPPYRFATTTSLPHLPFEDRFFDLIYAGSVFTHTSDLAEAWLLELRRVVRPGGRLYLTVHDGHSIDLLLRADTPLTSQLRSFDEESRFSEVDYAFFTINRTPGGGGAGESQVFYDIDFLRGHWGNYMEVLSVTPEAYGYQTAVILKR